MRFINDFDNAPVNFNARLEDIKHGNKLGEDEHLVPLGQQRFEQLEERGELARAEFSRPVDEGRVTADLPETQERGEEMELVLGELLLGLHLQEQLLMQAFKWMPMWKSVSGVLQANWWESCQEALA